MYEKPLFQEKISKIKVRDAKEQICPTISLDQDKVSMVFYAEALDLEED